jgi:hypothetical protein
LEAEPAGALINSGRSCYDGSGHASVRGRDSDEGHVGTDGLLAAEQAVNGNQVGDVDLPVLVDVRPAAAEDVARRHGTNSRVVAIEQLPQQVIDIGRAYFAVTVGVANLRLLSHARRGKNTQDDGEPANSLSETPTHSCACLPHPERLATMPGSDFNVNQCL